MATNLAKLVVSLEAQTAKYQRELEKANRKLGRFEKRQKRSLAAITKGFKTLGLAIAALAASVGIGSLIRQSINLADKFSKLNDRLGISVEAISELSFAADRAGVKYNQFALGIQRAQRRIAEAAEGTGEAKGALKELRLEASELVQLPLDQQLNVIADSFLSVEKDADKTRLAMKLFDSEGVALLQLLKDGSTGLDQMRLKARQLGFSFSKEGTQGLVDAKDSLTDLKTAVDALALSFSKTLAPALITIANIATDLLTTDLDEQIEQAQENLDKFVASVDKRRSTLSQIFNPRGRAGFAGKRFTPVEQAEFDRLQGIITSLKQEQIEYETLGGKIDRQNKKLKEASDLTQQRLEQVEELQELTLGFSSTPKYDITKRESGLGDYIDGLIDAQRESEKLDDVTRDLGFTFQSAFEDAIIESAKLSDVLKALWKDVLRIFVRSRTQPYAEALGSFFSNGFGGARAAGGPVSGGASYLVGERGPELFTPRQSGYITPNGGGVSVTYSIDARGVDEARVMSTMVPLLEQTRQMTVNDVRKLRREGRL